MINAIIPCGGVGKRSGLSYNKIFYPIDGAPLIVKTVRAFLSVEEITKIIVVYNEADRLRMEELFGDNEKIVLTVGGESRSESVKAGLDAVDGDAEYVVIHDGARPFVTDKLIRSVRNGRRDALYSRYRYYKTRPERRNRIDSEQRRIRAHTNSAGVQYRKTQIRILAS